MGYLSLALTGVATNYAVPQALIEVQFANGVLLGDPSTPRALLIGCKTSAGTATVDTQVYQLDTEANVITLFGAGSHIHRMFRRFTQVCRSAPMFAICPTESGGTAASDTITFTTAATAAGVVTYTCVGETLSVPFASGDAFDTVVAENLKNAINKQTHWPVAATRALGVVTVTAKIKGTSGNWIRHRVNITANCGTTVVAAAAKLAGGATDETYTNVLATLLASKYDYLVCGRNPTAGADAAIAALSGQVQIQALPTTGIRQQALYATAETLSNATTLVTAYNKPRNLFLWQKNGEWEPMEVAAQFAAARYNTEAGEPWANYDNYGTGVNDLWFVPAQASQADYASLTDQNSAISVGLTPVAAGAANKSYVVLATTAAGADPRIRDVAKVTVSDRFASDLGARYSSQWKAAGIADNEVDGALPYPPRTCTPDRMKYGTIAPLYITYRDAGRLINTDGPNGDIAAMVCGIDPTVTTRMNARIPLHVTPLMHQFAALVSEVSSG